LDRDLDQLKAWIIKKKQQGWPVTDICISAKISRVMYYRWWNRYLSEGKDGLKEKARGRPKGSDVEDSLKNKVIKMRKRYEWGPKKIAGRLNSKATKLTTIKLTALSVKQA
jgi:transposase